MKDGFFYVLIRFIPTDKPLADEIQAIEQAKVDMANGDVVNLSDVDWR